MEPGLLDLALVVMLVVPMAVLGVIDYRRLERKVAAGDPTARLAHYRGEMAWEWGLTIAVLAVWFALGRPAAELGFGLDTSVGFWIGLGLTLVAAALNVGQSIALRRNPARLAALAPSFEPVRAMMPSTRRESIEFGMLSVTAGICEEICYRGYLMAWIESLAPGLGTWGAALGSSVLFGIVHAYQGPKGILRTGFVGLLFAGLYVLTGSLWLPILLHALVDLMTIPIARGMEALSEAA